MTYTLKSSQLIQHDPLGNGANKSHCCLPKNRIVDVVKIDFILKLLGTSRTPILPKPRGMSQKVGAKTGYMKKLTCSAASHFKLLLPVVIIYFRPYMIYL